MKASSIQNANWANATEMHESTKEMLSQLDFIKDEQLFMNDLIKSYTLQLIDSNTLEQSRIIVENILSAGKEGGILREKIALHENQLGIILDDVDQHKMEEAYMETHKNLLKDWKAYSRKYNEIKKGLYSVISNIMKKEKQRRLLN